MLMKASHLELGLLVELPTLVDRPIQMNSYPHAHDIFDQLRDRVFCLILLLQDLRMYPPRVGILKRGRSILTRREE